MRENTQIRVPEVYFSDFTRKNISSEYFIMEKLSGKQLDKTKLSSAEKENIPAVMAKMAAQLHKVKNDRFGYIQNELFDNWYSAIRYMTENLLKDCAKKNKKSERGELLLSHIDRYKSILEKADCCMVNFDIWSPNIICERKADDIEYSWIDPERSFWGDRICDFVCLETMLPLEKKVKSLNSYNEVSVNPIAVTEQEIIRYNIALGYVALIMEVEKYYRYTPHHFGWWRNVFGSKFYFDSAFGKLK